MPTMKHVFQLYDWTDWAEGTEEGFYYEEAYQGTFKSFESAAKAANKQDTSPFRLPAGAKWKTIDPTDDDSLVWVSGDYKIYRRELKWERKRPGLYELEAPETEYECAATLIVERGEETGWWYGRVMIKGCGAVHCEARKLLADCQAAMETAAELCYGETP